ncbi:hypothetical protein BVAD3_40910 (plasmid) [Bacillus velezensis]|nr:hypothetical protein BVAD3_40910 [Bacillus velezensis]
MDIGVENIESFNKLKIQKELNAKPIYLDINDDNFNIGYVINDILLEAGFVPTDKNDQEGRGN